MPVTMTERKRQVIRWATDRRLDYGSSKIARLAGRVQKHDPTMSAQHAAEFLDSHTGIVNAGRVHTHADPTPAEALHHMHGNVPCARCEWQPEGWEPDWSPENRRTT